MNTYEQQYLDLLDNIMTRGVDKKDRTGVGTKSLFGATMRFDVGKEFPLLTTKRMFTKGIWVELEWLLKGRTDLRFLVERGCSIWTDWPLATYRKMTGREITREEFERKIIKSDEFSDRWGSLGPIYGKQWRDWTSMTNDTMRMAPHVERKSNSQTSEWVNYCAPGKNTVTVAVMDHYDQIAEALRLLKTDPFSRRNVVTAWNPAENDDMALHPCHCLFQFNCRPMTVKQRFARGGYGDGLFSEFHVSKMITPDSDNEDPAVHAVLDANAAPKFYVDVHLYQRSADTFLGVPFNMASYAMLLKIMVDGAGPDYAVGELVHTFGDVHVYNNQREQVKLQLSRKPRRAPRVHLDLPIGAQPWDFTAKCVEIDAYYPWPAIKAEVAV